MEDKMVELTRFTKVSEAEILANLLKSEGVDCYVRDGFMNQIYNGLDLGGVKVELLEKDLERATEIMKDFGYLSSAGSAVLQTPESADFTDDPEMINDSDDPDNPEMINDPDDPEMINGSDDPDDPDDLATAKEYAGHVAEHERKKDKLSRNMTIIGVLIILLAALIILLNKYFNG